MATARRTFNQAIFKSILIDRDDVDEVTLTELFDALFGDDIANICDERPHFRQKDEKTSTMNSCRGGSNVVGVHGLPTP